MTVSFHDVVLFKNVFFFTLEKDRSLMKVCDVVF